MGNPSLEVLKLGLYVTFPVALFYAFNQPRLFEDWVIKMKRELYPPESLTPHEELKTFVQEMRQKQQDDLIKQIQLEEAARR